jgi:hypothetical protein
MLKVVLEILKFCAITIGSISGLIGTLTETKDKITGKITPWGKRIVGLIVLSGIIAVSTQSIESYLKRVADREDHDRRVADEQRTQAILDKAKIIGEELGKQGESIGKTVAEVERTSSNVKSVQSAQADELLGVYRVAHPLGALRVTINLSYPIKSGIGGLESNWLARIRNASARPWALLRDANDPLFPRPDDEPREFRLLKEPEVDFEFNRTATQTKSDGKHLLNHGTDLTFRTTQPATSIYVHLDESRIDQQVESETKKLIDNQSVISNVDLYGAELIVILPPTAPTGSRVSECKLIFGEERVAFVELKDGDRRENPFNEPFSNISYVKVLTERELGSKPPTADRKRTRSR